MTDLSQMSDADLAAAAGMPQTALPPVSPLAHLSDADLRTAAGVIPPSKAAPSQTATPADFTTATMAQFPFSQDMAGLARGIAGLLPGGVPTVPGRQKDEGSFGANYEAGKQSFLAANAAYKANHPLLDRMAQGIGTLASLGGSATAAPIEAGADAVAQGGNLLARSLGSAAVAAPLGAVYGFGDSNGDLQGRLRAATTGAVGGGIFGAVAPTLSNLISAGIGKGAQLLGLGNPQNNALALITKALSRDNLTPPDLSSGLATAPAKPLMIADVAGGPSSATSRLARTVLDLPGSGSSTASDALATRDLGTGVNGPFDMFKTGGSADRISGDVKQALGAQDANQTIESLISQKKAASAPLYDAFRQEPPLEAAKLQPFMSSPTFKSALTRANGAVLDEGGQPLTDFFDFDPSGSPVAIKNGAIPPDVLDRTKQGIDDVWLAAKRSGDDGAARTANGLRSRFLGFMDEQYPNTYSAARSAFAGPSASQAAIEQGSQVFNTAPQDIAKTLQGLAPEDQDMFRLGGQQALIAKVRNTADGANEVRTMFGSPAKRDAIAALFTSPDDLTQLSQNLGIENRMYQTRQLGGGSRTAASLADQGDAGFFSGAPQAAAHLMDAAPFAATKAFVGPLFSRFKTGIGDQTGQSLARALFTPNDTGAAINAATIEALKNFPANQRGALLARSMMMQPALTAGAATGAGQYSGGQP